jgi:Holliday junction resolvase RusA-like endonuclease
MNVLLGLTGSLHVDAPGRPPVQGSFRPVKSKDGRVFLKGSSGDRNAEFRADLAEAMRRVAGGWSTIDVPCEVELTIRLRRPKSHFRTGRNAHLLRDDAPRLPGVKPDVDKVTRAVFDACTAAGVWVDDALVVGLDLEKHYATPVHPEGVYFIIWRRSE